VQTRRSIIDLGVAVPRGPERNSSLWELSPGLRTTVTVELSSSQKIEVPWVFSVRMAGSAPHFGEAVCLALGGIGLALQDGASFGLQVSLRCQISNVPGIGAPLTHRFGNTDR
jgi:hypothetical protein